MLIIFVHFHSMEEQISMFIEGLNLSFKRIVSQCRQDNPDVPFLWSMRYAKAQGAAQRARDKKTWFVYIQAHSKANNLVKTKKRNPNWKSRSSAYVASPASVSGAYTVYYPESDTQAEANVLVEDGSSNSHFLLQK